MQKFYFFLCENRVNTIQIYLKSKKKICLSKIFVCPDRQGGPLYEKFEKKNKNFSP